jgi:hypothetical protein
MVSARRGCSSGGNGEKRNKLDKGGGGGKASGSNKQRQIVKQKKKNGREPVDALLSGTIHSTRLFDVLPPRPVHQGVEPQEEAVVSERPHVVHDAEICLADAEVGESTALQQLHVLIRAFPPEE